MKTPSLIALLILNLKNIRCKIVGGDEAPIKDNPYMVSIHRPDWDNPEKLIHSCGGAIIRATHILSACHCFSFVSNHGVAPLNPGRFKILAGTEDILGRSKSSQWRGVTESHLHPYCQRSPTRGMIYDIAVVRVKPSFVLIPGVVFPILFVEVKTDIEMRVKFERILHGYCIALGWGSQDIKGSSQLLLRVSLKVIEFSECKKLITVASEGEMFLKCKCQMCALGAYGQDACIGDSGGPLVCKNQVYAIISFGIGCGRNNTPSIFTRVDIASNWIDEVLNGKSNANLAKHTFMLLYITGIKLL